MARKRHSDEDGLEMMRFGIGQAGRGWLEAGDVVNTRPLDAPDLMKRQGG